MTNLHRGVRLVSTLNAIQKILLMRSNIRGAAGQILADGWRDLPAIISSLAPGLGENSVTIFAHLQGSFLALEDNAPPFHEGVHVGQCPGAGKFRILEDGAEGVWRLRRMQLIHSSVGLS